MNPRRNDEQPEDMMRSGHRVHVPPRPITSPRRTGITPQLTAKPSKTAPIPLLDTEDEEGPKTVDINITFPTLPRPQIRKGLSGAIGAIKSHRRLVALSLVVIVGLGIYHFGPFSDAPGRTDQSGVAGVKTEVIDQKPDYPTILPAGKTVDELGGWKRISPPDRNAVFAYADKIDGIPVTVSEQPVPEPFKAELLSSVENLAKSYNATEKVTVGSTVAYVGTSAKGPQSVIFTKNDLLVLIKSTTKVTTNQWAAYISSLE